MRWWLLVMVLVLRNFTFAQSLTISKVPSRLNNLKGGSYLLVASNLDSLENWLIKASQLATIQKRYRPAHVALIECSGSLVDSLLKSHLVIFIDELRKPVEEVALPFFDKSTNAVNLLHDRLPSLNGSNTSFSLKENKPDTTDLDFRGRFISNPFSSPWVSTHATNMATVIAGAGNSFHTGKGVAWAARFISSDFASLLPDPDSIYARYNISVQNHSYGTAIENYYGADAAAFDASALSNPSLLHVFSAGNSGEQTSSHGFYRGLRQVANLTGSFKMAKNVLIVGATDAYWNVPAQSSRGPAYDGRIKPDLVAGGIEGTSGAAAVVSGIALVTQQNFQSVHARLPSSALLRSILITSADDIGATGPDLVSGFGSVNAFQANVIVHNNYHFEGELVENTTKTFIIQLSDSISELKATLCWNDLPGVPNSSKALMNDLDFKIRHLSSGKEYNPWILNTHNSVDSLKLPAITGRDTLNNVEQVVIRMPASGTYALDVSAGRVSGIQPFAVSYKLDTMERLEWIAPAGSDAVEKNKPIVIRWKSTLTDSTGRLEYHLQDGIWKLIEDSVLLRNQYHLWQVPDSLGSGKLKMTVGSREYFSDAFEISTVLNTNVEFACDDSLMISWNNVNAGQYEIYQLQNQYLTAVDRVSDTFMVVPKGPSSYYAVAPVMNRPGVKSYTFNYAAQGAGCFLNTFVVDLINKSARISATLGIPDRVAYVILQKQTRNGFVNVDSLAVTHSLLEITDTHLFSGTNTYRLKIGLHNGKTIFSSTESIFYFSSFGFGVYPNPTSSGWIRISSQDPSNQTFTLLNVYGQIVLQTSLQNETHAINVGHLKKGVYIFVIRDQSHRVTGRLVIQ